MIKLHQIAVFVSSAALLLLVVAGLSKFADLSAFEQSLAGWSLIPTWAARPVAIALPSLELFFGLAGLLERRTYILRLCAIALLTIMTGVILMHAIFAEVPSCLCFGRISAWLHQMEIFKSSAWVSSAMLVSLSLGTWLMRRTEKNLSLSSPPAQPVPSP